MIKITRNGQTIAENIITEDIAGIMAQALANDSSLGRLDAIRVETDEYTIYYVAQAVSA
jgi:hypothetical protein